MEPDEKKPKIEQPATCKHFVLRKKRNCKMTVAKGKEYCGEHEPASAEDVNSDRIPCPLDPKHTVYKTKLEKHLKICNAKPKEDLPAYIRPGVNAGSDVEDDPDCGSNLKLSDLSANELEAFMDRVELAWHSNVRNKVDFMYCTHEILNDEVASTAYAPDTRKHLVQASAILGIMEKLNLLKDKTSYVEFGAGKGQLTYWLAQVLQKQKQSKIVLVDRASLRHKKDNKLEDRSAVHRIRADIADFDMDKLEVLKDTDSVVALSKHLCGAATDLTLRSIVQAKTQPQTEAFVIAVCCHHRCEWKSFVGKKFFADNGLTRRDFVFVTKMASYAICGSGMSRERRKLMEEKGKDAQPTKGNTQFLHNNWRLSPQRRVFVGQVCKRLLDYSRVVYMNDNGFECSLKYYVTTGITLENVCIIGTRKSAE